MDGWTPNPTEREAIARAGWTFMGLNQEQLTWLVADYESRTGRRAAEIDPRQPIGVEL